MDLVLFIDTSFIMNVLFERRRRAQYDNNKIIEEIKSKYKIKIPQIVIGEIIVQIIKKTSTPNSKYIQQERLNSFFNLVSDLTDLNFNNPPINRDILRMALYLKPFDEDSRDMDYCDAIITSFALTSKINCHLLTSDKGIQESLLVTEKKKEILNNEGINVQIIDSTAF